MGFTVQPQALDQFAVLIGRAGDDASATKNFLDAYALPDGWPGALIAVVGPGAGDSMDAAIEACQKASAILYTSQTGLTDGATYYRQTDAAAAERIDTTLPGRDPAFATATEGAFAATGITPTFNDSWEPLDRLKPVDDVEFNHPLAFLDTISVSHQVLEVFNYVFGYNPLEDSLNFYLGDWQAVAKAAVAMENAANALDDLALNVQGGAVALHPAFWQGHAGETSYQFFARTAQGVETLVDPMRQIAEQLTTIATGAYQTSEAVSGFIKGMIDAAVIAGVAAAAGALAAGTGFGALFGFGIAALQTARILQLWAEATAVMTAVYSLAQTAYGIIVGQISRLRGADLPEPSGGSYTFPVTSG